MGCFNQTAFLSNLQLTVGTPTVLIFMIPNQPTNHAVYSTDQYQPIFLPVFGKYDDYGTIEDIVRDRNVLFLEDYFGVKIKNLIEAVDNNLCQPYDHQKFQTKKNNDTFQKLVFALEHQEVYDLMARLTPNSWYNYGDCTQYFLEDLLKLPFKGKTKDERYKKTYEIPGVKDYTIHTDDHWSHLVGPDGKQIHQFPPTLYAQNVYGTYHPRQLILAVKHFTGVDLSTRLTPEQLSCSLWEHRYNVDKLVKDQSGNKPYNYTRYQELSTKRLSSKLTEDELEEFYEIVGAMAGSKNEYKGEYLMTSRDGRFRGMESIYNPYLEAGILFDPKLKDLILGYSQFNTRMGHNSLTFKLSSYGGQETDWKFYQEFYQTALNVVNDRLKEREEDEELIEEE